MPKQELIQLIILLLAEKGAENKRDRIKQVIDLARRIENEKNQKFVLSGLLTVSNKFISGEDAEERILGMYSQEDLRAAKNKNYILKEKSPMVIVHWAFLNRFAINLQ